MSLSMYEKNLLEQIHNDVKLRLPKLMGNFEQSVKKLSINLEELNSYILLEAIKLDTQLPPQDRVFSADEKKKCLQKIKEDCLKRNQ